jgi:lysozyme family protein
VDNFLLYMAPILTEEGGGQYTDNPEDPGGPTIWGITQETAQHYGYWGELASMSEQTALRIYRAGFWQALEQLEKWF